MKRVAFKYRECRNIGDEINLGLTVKKHLFVAT